MNASPIFHRLALLAPLLSLGFGSVSCTGYQLQTGRPQALTHVKKISVPLFENKTLVPRGEALATNSVVDAITNDGTYRIASLREADAVLEGTMESITYSQVRSTRLDTLRSEEMENTVTLRWQLLDASTRKVLSTGKATGSSRFAIDANQQTARQNALPDALQRAATQVVGRLTDDF
jgi:hypothetical protein